MDICFGSLDSSCTGQGGHNLSGQQQRPHASHNPQALESEDVYDGDTDEDTDRDMMTNDEFLSLRDHVMSLSSLVSKQLSKQKKKHDMEIAELSKQQKKHDMEIAQLQKLSKNWCKRDLIITAAEVLKWSIGKSGYTPNFNEGPFSHPSVLQLKNIEVGREIFGYSTTEDYQTFAKEVLFQRNTKAHFSKIGDLNAAVQSCAEAIDTFPDLKNSHKLQCDVIEKYEELKNKLKNNFR